MNITEYSKALDLLFNNNINDGVVIRFESDGYVLYLDIRNDKTEIVIYERNVRFSLIQSS